MHAPTCGTGLLRRSVARVEAAVEQRVLVRVARIGLIAEMASGAEQPHVLHEAVEHPAGVGNK